MGVGALVATLTGSAAATGVIVDQAATLLMPSSELGSTVLGGAALAGGLLGILGLIGSRRVGFWGGACKVYWGCALLLQPNPPPFCNRRHSYYY